ncbi:hypothetical protein FA95DRAFT_1640934 [Auriscalpium vulgare]|uniref:Uncharacterized protein n=1 Tax=Auriscalpium vulgare TaxID=40419 RepID=A0ACB8RDS5_9AGAM|nr:hypothetical protein FA95DRAFT_1640934 [Auriscalpium vulgare]
MALRVVKKRTTGSIGIDTVLTTAKMAADVTNLMQFPPAAAAASIVLTIIQMVADIKINQNDCVRLARRAARLLVDLGKRMEGKWDDAPRALLDNIADFEITCISIRDFMQKASEGSWFSRFVSKAMIETALTDYERQLDDAAIAFQMASLIEIHYAIGTLQRSSTGGSLQRSSTGRSLQLIDSPVSMSPALGSIDPSTQLSQLSQSATLVDADPEELSLSKASFDSSRASSFVLVEETGPAEVTEPAVPPLPTEEEVFLASITEANDEFGFRRYHQSDVIIRKANRKAVGWFAGTADAQANGQKMTIKRYEGPKEKAVRQWMKDVKMLRNLYHENLPQILGYSDGKAQTPFILLASVPSRDMSGYVQMSLNNLTLAGSAGMLLKLYRDITSAVLHVQRQLALTNSQAQDFIEGATYTVDADNCVVLGLPPLKEGLVTARSYNLQESLVDRALQFLKDLEAAEETRRGDPAQRGSKIHSLLRSLLPQSRDDPTLPSDLLDLLDDAEDDDRAMSLPALRSLSIARQRHDQSWHERAPVRKCAVGDYGWIPQGTRNFEEFVRLGNVFEDCNGGQGAEGLEVVLETTGTQVHIANRFPERTQCQPYPLPDELEGWPIALMPQSSVTVFVRRESRMLSVNDAWQFLLNRASTLATRHSVKQHNLLLVTRSLTVEDYQVHDRSPPPLVHRSPFPPMNGFPGHNPFAGHQQHVHHFGAGPFNPVPIPTLVYLFTSGKEGFSAYITDNALGKPRPQEFRSTAWMFACQAGWPAGFVDYIQLDPEDAES